MSSKPSPTWSRAQSFFATCLWRAALTVLGLGRKTSGGVKFVGGLLWRLALLGIPNLPAIAAWLEAGFAVYLPDQATLWTVVGVCAAIALVTSFFNEVWMGLRRIELERDDLQLRLGRGLVVHPPASTFWHPVEDELDYPESSDLTFTGWSVQFRGMTIVNQSEAAARLSFRMQVRVDGEERRCRLQPQGVGKDTSLALGPRESRELALAVKVDHRIYEGDEVPYFDVDWIEVEDLAHREVSTHLVDPPPIAGARQDNGAA